jgi:hypothetical protein
MCLLILICLSSAYQLGLILVKVIHSESQSLGELVRVKVKIFIVNL